MNANTMRYLDDGTIDLIEVTVGDPADNEVQVQGGACGICSWDIATAKLGKKMYPMAPAGHEVPQYPFLPSLRSTPPKHFFTFLYGLQPS